MKITKMAILILMIVIMSWIGNVQQNEVKAENSKTQCVLTDDGGFFCEGNQGYDQAVKGGNR